MSTTDAVTGGPSRPSGSVFFGLFRRVRSVPMRRRTPQNLHNLSDRQLADIGLVRSEVDTFAQSTIIPFI
jgi:uncharacterized protein YjiS (DUF1127 family)